MRVLSSVFVILSAVSLFSCSLFNSTTDNSATITARERRQIERRLDAMEDALEQNRPLDVAKVYFDSGYLLAPNSEPTTGRAAIDRYWQAISGVKDWELETLLTTRRLEEIYAHPAYRNLKTKPPGWDKLGIQTGLAVYQLGTSVLRHTGRDGKDATSRVTYILVWEAARDGGWRIRVDTYAGS